HRVPRFRDKKSHLVDSTTSTSVNNGKIVTTKTTTRQAPPTSPSSRPSGMEVSTRVKQKGGGAEEAYDPPLPREVPVEVYDSGPILVANMTNREATGYELPGEGKIFRTLEEGSRVV